MSLISKYNKILESLDNFGNQQNKTLVDEGNEFYGRSMKSCLQENKIEIYSRHNEGKSFVAERFIRT